MLAPAQPVKVKDKGSKFHNWKGTVAAVIGKDVAIVNFGNGNDFLPFGVGVLRPE